MANADKCHLNIPFKTYLGTLADAVDGEGKIDPAALKLAAGREFENYKAIERRVNNGGCGGSGCGWGFTGYEDYIGTLTPGGTTNITLVSDGLYVPSTYPLLPAGMWHVTGVLNVTTSSTGTNQRVSIFQNGSGGGYIFDTIIYDDFISSVAGVIAIGTAARTHFSGVLWQTAPWAPTVTITNANIAGAADVNFVDLYYKATGIISCAGDVGTGGAP